MNAAKGFGIVFLFFLVFSVSVSAEIEINKYGSYSDFEFSAYNQQPSVCLCESKIDRMILKNTGSFHAVFDLSTSNSLVELPFSSVELAPNQEVFIDALMSVPCKYSSGSRDYSVFVSNNYGKSQEIKRKLSINECSAIAADLYADKDVINPCDSVIYNISLVNTAPFLEKYFVEPERMVEYFDYAGFTLELLPNQSGFIQTKFSPSCDVYGNKSLSFKIYGENSRSEANLNHDLMITQNYSFEVVSDSALDVCQYSYAGREISVKNNAGMLLEYSLSLINSPDFISLNESYFKLNPGEVKKVYLSVEPGQGSVGARQFLLEIKTNIGDTSSLVPFNLTVSECYSLGLKIENPFDVCTGDSSFNLIVENNGVYDEVVLLQSSNEGIVVPAEVSVPAGSAVNVMVLSSFVENQSKLTIPFEINASLKNRPTWLSWNDNAIIDVYEQYLCTLPSFQGGKIYARFYDSNKSIKISNAGFKDSNYSVVLVGSSWLSVGQDKIYLQEGLSDSIVINLYSDDSEVQNKYYFDLVLTSDNNGMTYVKNYELVLTDTPFTEKAFNFIMSSVCTIITASLLVLFVLILLSLWGFRRLGLSVSSKFKAFVAVLIFIVIVASLIVFGVPKSVYPDLDSEKVNNPLYLIGYQDKSLSLDLTDYFVDPDGDILEFSVQTVPENVTVTIKDSFVYLIPDEGWSGFSRVRFSAVDEFGEEVVSPSFDLEIVPFVMPSVEQLYFKYCPFINASLLVLCLILFLVFPTKTKVEKKRKQKGKVVLTKIKREKGYLYFVDKDGDVSRRKISRNKK